MTVPTKCKNCRYKFSNNGHKRSGCPLDGERFLTDDDFCSADDDLENANEQ